jgi:hypothetical protein
MRNRFNAELKPNDRQGTLPECSLTEDEKELYWAQQKMRDCLASYREGQRTQSENLPHLRIAFQDARLKVTKIKEKINDTL